MKTVKSALAKGILETSNKIYLLVIHLMGICIRNKRIMNLKLALLVVLLPTAVFIRLKLHHSISSSLDIQLLPVKRTRLTSFKVNRWCHCPLSLISAVLAGPV